MSEPYLILHRVRGEPAFDIAIEIEKDMWIIPTSGHRAYPAWTWSLEDLADISDINNSGFHNKPYQFDTSCIPEDWPDHYSANDRPTKSTVGDKVSKLLEIIGVKPKREEVRRA